MILLSTLVPSISASTLRPNVWDLPLWAWQSYAAFHDDYVKQMREAERG